MKEGRQKQAVCSVFICLIIGISNGDSVTQSQTSVPVKEDENTTIHCQYETTGSLNLFWYIQERNKAPQHTLGLYSSTESRFKEHFSASHDKSEKTFNLTLSAAVLSDSATYFCAESHTVSVCISPHTRTSFHTRFP
ncbi:hypothetical protein AOXY_G25664 [Acipenser oxyrinchus oxyrinchus]|uniref:Ig-like domain-containing protein n=1 Tax=Acipenser oxyrinchus oxyrinchus TaxID=40147 RepID=A0AAD8CTU7_ACIOX|nr:hypothetical protein AOXY_G25664 [Acipenser oxyrinchus oxyrinchus]